MKFACVTLLMAFAVLLGCSRKPSDPFPAEASGWTKAGATRTFESAKLADYIDGDAERFLQAGVQKALTADYRAQNGAEAVADVFVMNSAQNAKKIYESEPAAGSQPVSIGEAGRSYGQTVTFQKGPYFVRVVGYQESVSVVELAKALDAALK